MTKLCTRSIQALLVCVIVLAPAAYALEFGAAVGVTASYSDNANRSSNDQIDEWTFAPTLGVQAQHNTERLLLESAYGVYRRIHERDSTDDRTALTGSARLAWNIVPGRFTAFANHTRAESTIDASRPNDASNRQETQRSQAGLQYTQPLFSTHSLRLTATHQDDFRERTNNDGTLQSAEAAYVIQLTPLRSLELFATVLEREFDDLGEFDSKSESAGVQFASTSRHGGVLVRLGYTDVDRDPPFDDVDGGIGTVRLFGGDGTINWAVGAQRSIDDLGGASDFDAQEIDIDTIIFVGGDIDNTNTADTYIDTNFTGEIGRQFGANNLTLSAGYLERDFEVALLDRDTVNGRLLFTRLINERTTLNAGLEYSQSDFIGEGFEAERWLGRAGIEWEISRKVNSSVTTFYVDRSTKNGGTEYDEWGVVLSLNYVFAPELK